MTFLTFTYSFFSLHKYLDRSIPLIVFFAILYILVAPFTYLFHTPKQVLHFISTWTKILPLLYGFGAHNGLSINNTLFFEINHNWKGINIEPIKEIYDKLIINRPNNINLNITVCNYNGTCEFICNTCYTEMIYGLK